MNMVKINLLIRFAIFSLLLVGCNRPVPTKKVADVPASQTPEPLLLTRTSIANQIMATLTAMPEEMEPIAATATEPSLMSSPEIAETPLAPVQPTLIPELETTVMSPVVQAEQPVRGAMTIPEVIYLHKGEFPWCLARRYNIDPNQIMAFNGFVPGQYYYNGQPVYLPANPLPFPGPTALRPHPVSHTVGAGETVYSIACYYGDIDPELLAEINGITVSDWLAPGMSLAVP